jgi:hypothetical protein
MRLSPVQHWGQEPYTENRSSEMDQDRGTSRQLGFKYERTLEMRGQALSLI